ncbi:NFACT RNA binding domain-containing protein [Listeria sp. PSOL-1]|uniref:Rqc2 family fibronectin-binding protein n=1 Tax=Listeria sp. PSOL-1 TaxID=1844999 RepID=UPI0013D428B1|nr:NFACT RNA binding domain-containing protein [Listeria sp. PSOL-1]
MAFDAMFLKAMTKEVKHSAESGRIMKIHQPFSNELILHIRKNRENKRLFISAHPSYARIQWTSDIPENPAEPPMFCMLLRKYLEGGIIESIRQIENERILIFTIRGKDDIGENRFSELYVEIMGRHSNIILVDREKETIVDCIKHVPAFQNTYRTLLPGARYILPPAIDKLNPFTTTEEMLFTEIQLENGKVTKQLVQKFAGFSPLIAEEILTRTEVLNPPSLKNAFFSVVKELKQYSEKTPSPTLFMYKEKEDYYFMPLQLGTKKIQKTTLSELLDSFYLGKARRDRVHQIAHDLEKLLTNELAKNLNKIEKLKNTRIESEKADDYRIKGDLLTANLYQISKKMDKVTVENFYDENSPKITISLDTRKTPSENAQSYFSRYQKLRNAVGYVNEQITQTKAEIKYIESVQSGLETASPEDVEEIRQELAEQGYIRFKSKIKRKKNSVPHLEKYQSTTGLTILVGKNNKQNDYLTNKLAKNNEMWFHVKDLPGSHVVMKGPNPDEESISQAAMLAAYFSKARLSASVPVDATLIKYVKKPSGAKPGYVIYDHQTTYFVTPDEALVAQLKIR